MPSQWSAEDRPGPGIHVRGGAHGLTVEYRELESVAGVLEGSVARLTTLRSRCMELYLLLSGTSAVHAHARSAAGAAELVIQGLKRNTEQLEEAAGDLRRAAGNYLDTEGRLAEAIKWAAVGVPMGIDVWRSGGGGFPDRTVSEMIVPPFDGFLIRKLLEQLAKGDFGELRPIEVTMLEGDHGTVPLDGSVKALLERSKGLLDSPDRGVVEILTLDEGGRRVRIVTLPGNQDSGSLLVGSNPFDNYGNAEGRAEDSRYVAAAVADALRQAGASADDAVILVGYSQGGIHAVNTGARLAEAEEFDVEMIVTAGAPAGDRDTPDGVKVLHFEHARDWVAGLDGAANPDTPDRVTVTGAAPVEGVPSGGLGPAHDLDLYLELAGRADSSENPSLEDSRGHLADIILPSAIATRGLFRFSRKPAAKPPARPPVGPVSPGNGMSPLPLPGHAPPVLVNPVAPIKVPPVVPPIPVPPVVPPGR